MDKRLIPRSAKDIPGYEGLYCVTKLGEVFFYGNRRGANHNGKRLSECSWNGYMKVTLCKDSVRRRILVHSLVARTFIGDVRGMTVNHKNGIKHDNSLGNLEIITRSENTKHGWATGLISKQDRRKSKFAKLTDPQIKEIRSSQLSQRKLADIFGVSQRNISKIKHRESWNYDNL